MGTRHAVIEHGMVFVIAAVLLVVLLQRFWPDLPGWARVAGIAAVVALGVIGYVSLGRPGGLASRGLQRDDRDAGPH